jgi:hypothetical protein
MSRPSNLEQYTRNYYIQRGLPPLQASAIASYLLAESTFDPRGRNPRDGRDGSDSIGQGQWNSSRARNLMSFAASRGKSWDDRDTQLDFVLHEFQTAERRPFQRLMAARTPEEATAAMVSYGRPGGYNIRTSDPTGVPSWRARLNNTNRILGNANYAANVDPNTARSLGIDGDRMDAITGPGVPTPPDAARMNAAQFERYVGQNSPSTSNNPALAFQEDQATIRDGYVAGRPDIRSPNTPPASGLAGLGQFFARQQTPQMEPPSASGRVQVPIPAPRPADMPQYSGEMFGPPTAVPMPPERPEQFPMFARAPQRELPMGFNAMSEQQQMAQLLAPEVPYDTRPAPLQQPAQASMIPFNWFGSGYRTGGSF